MNEYIDPPEPGVYPDVLMEEYHQWDAASNSRLTRLYDSPAHLKAYLEGKEDTDSLKLGRLIHMIVLEPGRFEEECVVLGECEEEKGDGDKCTYSAKYATPAGPRCGTHGSEEDHDDSLNIVKEDDVETARAIREAIKRKASAREVLFGEEGDTEYTLVWDDPETGVRCRARMDRYSPALPGGVIVDLKTTRNAALGKFQRSIWKYRYDFQAAFYLRGARALDLDLSHFIIVAVEKRPPHGIGVYRLPEGTVRQLDGHITDCLKLYRECKESGTYPDYPDEIKDIERPNWADDKLESRHNEIVHHLKEVQDD